MGSGTYAIVKEAVHIKTGKYYACKVINKKLMEGREHMVRNEIAVLKKVSQGHANIVTLHDYFETSHNLYLIFFGLDLPSHMPFSMRLQGNRRRILTSSGTRGGLEGGDVARVDGKTPGDDAVDLDDGVVDIRKGS